MKKLRINIILPFPVTKPVGGPKIMYEYANRLAQHGHEVHIFHSIKRPFKKSGTPLLWKQLVFALRGVARPKWFELDKRIKSVIVPEITDKYIPAADIILSTWWQMAYAVNDLSPTKGEKFNLIQDYEIWGSDPEKVDASFALALNQLVIARYLQKMVFEKTGGIQPEHIPNAIDEKRFFIERKIEDRDPNTLVMLYSQEPRKGTQYGIDALKIVQQNLPELRVHLFGVYPKPVDLPPWINYTQKPADLRSLYSNAAVFFSPSLGEGWALPPAEAMACGCAVVCTNIGGHLDYAIDKDTALLVEPKDIDDMANKIAMILKNNALRLQIAANGYRLITTEFSWGHSVNKLENCFYNALKK